MRTSQIALQLYTLRDHVRDEAGFLASMKRVREIGYGAVQISGVGPIAPEILRRICEDNALRICATHEPAQSIVEAPGQVVERLHALGCTHTAYPFPHVPLKTASDAQHLARLLNHAGEVLAQDGITLSYHNHALELRRDNDRTLLEILYAETDPRFLKAEIDTYWVQAGGGDPVAYCTRLAGRLPLIHLKDFAIGEDNQPRMAEVGHGNLDFPRILAAADAAGCQWFIVEQDNGFEDAFRSINMSLRYLERLATPG